MLELTLAEAQATLGDLIKRIRTGEEVTITEDGKAVAHLRALELRSEAPKRPVPSRAEERKQYGNIVRWKTSSRCVKRTAKPHVMLNVKHLLTLKPLLGKTLHSVQGDI